MTAGCMGMPTLLDKYRKYIHMYAVCVCDMGRGRRPQQPGIQGKGA